MECLLDSSFLHLTVVQWLLTISILLVPVSAPWIILKLTYLIVTVNKAGPLIQTKFFPRLDYLNCGLFCSLCSIVAFYQFQIYQCRHLQSRRWRHFVVLTTCKSTLCYNLEDHNIKSYCLEIFTSSFCVLQVHGHKIK